MKRPRHGPRGAEAAGSLHPDGTIQDRTGLVTRDEVGAPQDLRFWPTVNGVARRHGLPRTKVHRVTNLVRHPGHFLSPGPGDVILTGTPPGARVEIRPRSVCLKGTMRWTWARKDRETGDRM